MNDSNIYFNVYVCSYFYPFNISLMFSNLTDTLSSVIEPFLDWITWLYEWLKFLINSVILILNSIWRFFIEIFDDWFFLYYFRYFYLYVCLFGYHLYSFVYGFIWFCFHFYDFIFCFKTYSLTCHIWRFFKKIP